jgi:serine palmitoyltransferase
LISFISFVLLILAGLILLTIYILLIKRSYDPTKRTNGSRTIELTEAEEDEIISEWNPESLVKGVDTNSVYTPVIDSFKDQVTVVLKNDKNPKVSFASSDFLGLAFDQEQKEKVLSTLDEYTVGSCGPRGFYGTTLEHIGLETTLAEFFNTEEAITYSDTAATIGSVIPAFAKKGDLLLVDCGVNQSVIMGTTLSRSKVTFWRHNETAHLKQLLETVAIADKARKYDSRTQRRFIVVEGVYFDHGDLCPLDEVVKLARQFKWRVIVDDSFGVGILGATGRGTREHFGLSPSDVDILVGSMATSLGSVGGFCVGKSDVVDHQRLSGLGYCFSASAPAYLCAVAASAVKQIEKKPRMVQDLQSRASMAHTILSSIPGLDCVSSPVSPIKVFTISSTLSRGANVDSSKIQRVINEMRALGFLISKASPSRLEGEGQSSVKVTVPAIKISININHTKKHVEALGKALQTVLRLGFDSNL